MTLRPLHHARSGLALAEATAFAAARNIALSPTDAPRASATGVEGPDGGVVVELSETARSAAGGDLARDAVDLVTAKVLYRANLAVIRAEDERLGQLLDRRA